MAKSMVTMIPFGSYIMASDTTKLCIYRKTGRGQGCKWFVNVLQKLPKEGIKLNSLHSEALYEECMYTFLLAP